MKKMFHGLKLLCVAVAGLSAGAAAAAEPAVKWSAVASGYENPSGIAVHAGTGHVFFAATTGVYRLDPASKKVYEEVTGFPVDIYGKGPKYNIGPLGVALLGTDHLVVGDGSQPDGKEVVRVFRIGANPPATPANASSAEFTLGPVGPGDASPKGEGNFYGVAVNSSGIFITANGDDTKGWILKAPVKDGKPGELAPFIATKPLVNVDAPVAITTTEKGSKLVVGQMGEINVAGDSQLTFYDANDGKLISNHKTGLSDISGLAYSPKTGKLYAVDFSWIDTTKGALYRLDIANGEVTPVKIVDLDKPTAIAFGTKGELFVTVCGPTTAEKPAAGSIIEIEPGL